jgi:gluconate kinase
MVEIGKRSVSEELAREFETVLAEADKLYDEIEKDTVDNGVSRRKEIVALQ